MPMSKTNVRLRGEKGEIYMPEIWKEIESYNGFYKISNKGKVINKYGKLIKPIIQKGYVYVHLCKNYKDQAWLLHRLVAIHFIPNPDNLPEVNHKDENKLNNEASNLEWCTAKYNSNYGTRNERKAKPIQCVETGIVYWGARELERQTGIKHNNIAKAIKNHSKAGGYHWSYASKEGGEYDS